MDHMGISGTEPSCKTSKARSFPLYLTLALAPPPTPFFFLFFCSLKNLLRLKINIMSSIYPELNFPTEPVMKVINLSRPKVPAPAPPPPTSESNCRPLIYFHFYRVIRNNRICFKKLNTGVHRLTIVTMFVIYTK